jgi:hypothetical protein
MERLKDTVTDFIYTLVSEQRSMTGEFNKVDAEKYSEMLMDSVNAMARETVRIDEDAINHILDIGTSMAANIKSIPNYPALVILALEEYMLRRGSKPNFTLVQKR